MADPIDDQFSKIWDKITPGGSGASPIKNEPIEGNSLIQFLRSFNNSTGAAGFGTLGGGADVLSRGIQSFQQPFDYYSAILSGDPNALSKAIAPTLAGVDKQYAAAQRGAQDLMPRGGSRSATLAELPFQKAGVVSNAILSQGPAAAEHLSQIAQVLSQLGLNQEQIGEALLQLTANTQLGIRGQDVSEHGQAMSLAGSLGSALIGGSAGVGSAQIGAAARRANPYGF